MKDIGEMDVRLYNVCLKNEDYVVKNITDDYEHFKKVIRCAFIKVGDYVRMDEIPEVYLYDKESSFHIMNELALQDWVKAISVQGQIHLFSGYFESRRQVNILKHEMFHCGVYQCTKKEPLIPTWFNEAIAYYLCNNSQIRQEVFTEIKKIPLKDLKLWIRTDSVIENYSLGYDIIKSIGDYFCNYYQATTIKDIVYETWTIKDFDKAFMKHTLLSVNEFLDGWHDKLIGLGCQKPF